MTFKRIAFLLLILLAVPASSAEQPRYLEITFLSTNDLHGKSWPFDIPPDPAKNYPGIKDVGGAARRATVVRQIRSQARTPVMLVDCGDVFGWTALSQGFRGALDFEIMNRLGYDAMVIGNHEFEWQPHEFHRNWEASKFPWLCANVVYKDTGKLFADPYVIRDVGGVRVALFGLTNDLIEKQPDYYKGAGALGVKWLPYTEAAAKLVPELRKKADIVVLLSHLGYREDVKLAQDVPGIDIILGAHSHSTILTPTMVKVGERTAYDRGAVPVVQAGEHGRYLGKTRTVFRRDPESGRYTLMSCRGELVPLDASIPADPEIDGLIREWEAVRKAREAKKAEAEKKAAQ